MEIQKTHKTSYATTWFILLIVAFYLCVKAIIQYNGFFGAVFGPQYTDLDYEVTGQKGDLIALLYACGILLIMFIAVYLLWYKLLLGIVSRLFGVDLADWMTTISSYPINYGIFPQHASNAQIIEKIVRAIPKTEKHACYLCLVFNRTDITDGISTMRRLRLRHYAYPQSCLAPDKIAHVQPRFAKDTLEQVAQIVEPDEKIVFTYKYIYPEDYRSYFNTNRRFILIDAKTSELLFTKHSH